MLGTHLCYFYVVPLMSLSGVYIISMGRIGLLKNVILRGPKARIAGLFLLLPVLSILTLFTYDPMLFAPFLVGGTTLGISNTELYGALYHMYWHAGAFLGPIGLLGALVWTVAFREKDLSLSKIKERTEQQPKWLLVALILIVCFASYVIATWPKLTEYWPYMLF